MKKFMLIFLFYGCSVILLHYFMTIKSESKPVSFHSKTYANFVNLSVKESTNYFSTNISNFYFSVNRSTDYFSNKNRTRIILIYCHNETPSIWQMESYCPEFNCQITNDKQLADNASAVVFNMRYFDWNDIPANRHPMQRYIFQMRESPLHTDVNLDKVEHFFNWTMTYRLDTDVFDPYGFLMLNNTPPAVLRNYELLENPNATVLRLTTNEDEILGENKSLVVWMVGNCKASNKREIYVKYLSEHIQVDIYGLCGTLQCSKDTWTVCAEMIGKNYKFYIAFENSICQDYITEKIYARIWINSVPIVLKRKFVENILPDNSFIAADDFASPKFLANYLKYLSNNDAAYLKYFEWRKLNYHKLSGLGGKDSSYCLLCRKLWNDNEPSKSYRKMSTWWIDGRCDKNFINTL